jgi:hypothetical protein
MIIDVLKRGNKREKQEKRERHRLINKLIDVRYDHSNIFLILTKIMAFVFDYFLIFRFVIEPCKLKTKLTERK